MLNGAAAEDLQNQTTTGSRHLGEGGNSRIAYQTDAPDQKAKPSDGKPQTTFSPLHTFLGIDPTTDTFTRPGPRRKTAVRSDQKPVNGETALAGQSPAEPGLHAPAGAAASAPTDAEDIAALESAEQVRAAIIKALQEGDQTSIASLLTALPQGVGYERLLQTSRRYSYVIFFLLMLYPVSVLGTELFHWIGRRNVTSLGERERAYLASRARRRLSLAVASMGTIVLFWWGTENNFWWDKPPLLAAFATAVLVLLVVAALLRFMIRRAAVQYPVLVIRELQLKQLKLQEEVEELQKRLHSLRFAGGLS
jgi:hypothetical protein